MFHPGRTPIRWVIATFAVLSAVVAFAVSVPSASAEEYVSTTSISPEGEEYNIGWTVPSNGGEANSRFKRATESHVFETNHLENGLQTLIHLENPEAPEEFRFPLNIPQNAEIVTFSEGSEDSMGIFQDGKLLATIAHPWAHDSTGKPVPTSLTIEDGVLVQRVEHNAEMVFPITADPQIDWGWKKTTIKLSKKETQVAGGATGAGALAALPWMAALGVTGPLAPVILAAAGKLSFDAIRAHRRGKCLGIVVNTNVLSTNGGISTFEYSCS